MKKIELVSSEKPEIEKKEIKPKKNKKIVKKLAIIGGIIVLLGTLLTFFLVLPSLQMKDEALLLTNEAKQMSESLQAQDLNKTIEKLQATKEQFSTLNASYRKLAWLRIIPLVSNFYKDGEHLFAGGGYLLEAADVTVESLEPYADILGFEREKNEEKKEGETKKEMTAEERLILMLDTLEKIQPNLDKIGEKLELARQEIDQIDSQRYPEKIRDKKIREKIATLIQTIDGVAEIMIEAKPIIGYIRPLLGVPDQKKYLLLFQNDAELRPTGGFLTAYAILTVHNGNFETLGSYDIYSLDARFGNRLQPPEPIKKYHKNVYYWHLRDMNLSPDLKDSMETFWENYKKAGGPDVDGIIAIDTNFLIDILKVLGPIGVADWGNFSAEIDKRCNCPQVFYELERYADKPVGELKTDRKAVIGPLMHSVLLNVMQSPRKKWPEFFNVFFANVQQKHLLLYFFDEELQKSIEALNAGGRIKDYDGDYLHINDCNFAGAKSNMFIRVNVDQKVEVNSSGEAIKTVTIDYRNPEPASDCNLERGELCLNALYRDWVRLYVPKGSELIEASGSETEVETYEDLGKTVFEAFYGDKSPLRPEGKAQLTFKYKLPFKVEGDKGYKLLIQKQPGTYGYEYSVSVDGKQETFELKTDRELRF